MEKINEGLAKALRGKVDRDAKRDGDRPSSALSRPTSPSPLVQQNEGAPVNLEKGQLFPVVDVAQPKISVL